jgi:hypothetical protein
LDQLDYGINIDREQWVKKILEFLFDFLIEILLIPAMIFFLWWACMPEYKFHFVFFVILLLSIYIESRWHQKWVKMEKILTKTKVSKILAKVLKFLTIVLAIFLGYTLLFSLIGSFIVGWKIWLIILGIGLIYWFITEIML